MISIVRLWILLLLIWHTDSLLVTTSANPLIFSFEGEVWRNVTSRLDREPRSPTLQDHMHSDMVVDCSMLAPSRLGAVVQVQHKWTLFAAGRWYLFPHAIWKRFHDLERLKGEIVNGGCDVWMETRFGLAEANFHWNFGLEEMWIELPLVRVNERLMIRGGGHVMEWISDRTYQHSFQLKSFDADDKVGRLLISCPDLVAKYPQQEEMLETWLFRRDETPFYWPNMFLPPWISRRTGEIAEAEVVDIDAKRETCSGGEGLLYQPLMFLQEHWTPLQLYLLETYNCDFDELENYRIYWMTLQQWDESMKRKAQAAARLFPYLRVIR